MKRTVFFLLVVVLTGSLVVFAQMRGGGGQRGGGMSGRQGGGMQGGGPQMSGPQHPSDPHHGQRQQQSRTRECEQWCTKAREEARHLERYCEASRFDPETARQLGRQLGERLQVMEEHHAALRQRLSAAEREQQQNRLRAMEESQQRWRGALAEVERELGKETPSREAVRRHARSLNKELKKFQKEMHALEDSLGG
jgi:chromosome segregation ATPase